MYVLLVILLVLGVCHGQIDNCNKGKWNKKKQEWLCKEVGELQKLLTTQTAAMTAQATSLGTRLDQSDAKLKELQDEGTKMTELMSQQQAKLQEQGDALLAQEDKLSEQITQQGTMLTDKITSQETKLADLEGKEAQLTEDIGAQDKKITTK